MKTFYFSLIFLFAAFVSFKATAQETADSASMNTQALKDSLEVVRISEANMRMELELMRYKMASADSIKREEQRRRIDSLRVSTPGIPVVVGEDTLFYIFAMHLCGLIDIFFLTLHAF